MKEELNIPKHIGIIMDGNGRWAKQRGLIRSMGHREGANALKNLCLYINKKGIEYLSVYAFSCENFKRDSAEVNFLMDLFVKMFTEEFDTVMDNNVKIIFSGKKEPLPEKVLNAMQNAVEKSKNNTGSVLNICLNYDGQEEIVDATKVLCEKYKNGEITLEEINKSMLYDYMYQQLPPLDFVIRTSGENRISGFMIYQSSYAEFYFPNVLFPDFNEEEFDKAILEYNKRDRRFGGIKNK